MNGHNPKTNQEFDDAGIAALLGGLPRVSAPTNFDAQLKARIAAAQSEAIEFAEVTNLMRELPRVTVPANFNAQLQVRIAAAQAEKAERAEFAGVTALLNELPRVTAPNDFDFKLRARLAQAKSKEQKSPFGWFAELFNFSFSWAQTAAALALIAVLVGGVTYKILPTQNNQGSPNQTIATNHDVVPQPAIVAATPAQNEVKNSVAAVRPVAVNNSFGAIKVKAQTIHVANHPVDNNVIGAAPYPAAALPHVEAPAADQMIAGTVMIKQTKNGSARLIKVSEVSLGQQAATAHRAVASVNNNELAAQIY